MSTRPVQVREKRQITVPAALAKQHGVKVGAWFSTSASRRNGVLTLTLQEVVVTPARRMT